MLIYNLQQSVRDVDVRRYLTQMARHLEDLQGNIAHTAEISHAIMRVGSNFDDGLYDRFEDEEYEIINEMSQAGLP